MKQLKDLQGVCKYCVGDCLRLEDEDFKGVYRCKNFEANQVNWEDLLEKELRKDKS